MQQNDQGKSPHNALSRISDEKALAHLGKYFGIGGTKDGYTGSYFESLGSEREMNPNTITAEDLIAVSMLSVHVPVPCCRYMCLEGRHLESWESMRKWSRFI